MLIVKLLVATCVLVAVSASGGSSWSYSGDHGPSHWKSDYPDCGGEYQSPINLDQSQIKHRNMGPSFLFGGYDTVDTGATISNNGHSATVSLSGTAKVHNGGLPGAYQAAQFHFHWGSSADKGSEHTLNDKQFPLEVHIVHFNTKYAGVAEAMKEKDGLAVLGIFVELTDDVNEANAEMTKVAGALANIKNKGEEYAMPPVVLSRVLPQDTSKFYRYQGSLTTPGCYESVVWTVFKNTIKITPSQLDAFRGLSSGSTNEDYHALVDNYRPVQELGSREVYQSFPKVPESKGKDISYREILDNLIRMVQYCKDC